MAVGSATLGALPLGSTTSEYAYACYELTLSALSAVGALTMAVLLLPARAAYVATVGPSARARKFRSVLITGASSGIGEEMAYQWAREGARVVLVARRAEQLTAVKQRCEALGARAVRVCVASVTDQEGMAAAINTADAEEPLELVIANAGVAPQSSEWVDALLDPIRPTLATNVTGTMNTVEPAVRLFRARRAGQIAITSSAAGIFKPIDEEWNAYVLSKQFQVEYATQLRHALAPHQVGVTVFTPGYVATAMAAAVEKHGAWLVGQVCCPDAVAHFKEACENNTPQVFANRFGFVHLMCALSAPLPGLFRTLLVPIINALFMKSMHGDTEAKRA
jgi:NADP-dependent 3-hydroxy acid dehydrogenase YdfG